MGLVLLGAGSATAQTASQIAPRSFEPPSQTRGNGLVIPQDSGTEAPAGSDRLSVRIRSVRVEGGLPALAETEARIGAGLAGRNVTAAALFGAAKALEQAYVAAGYALVRVVLPAQRLDDRAVLRLVVVDGTIERVDTEHLPADIRERIAAILEPLVGQRGVTMSAIERKLLLAGDTPGTVLRSTLAPGSKPGGTVLVVEARYKSVTGLLGGDNTLSKALGRYTSSFGLDLNAPTGNGELLFLRAGGYPVTHGSAGYFDDHPRNRFLAAGLTLPLGFDGLALNVEVLDARAAPRANSSGLGIGSDFMRYAARLRYPLIRARDLILNVETGIDVQDERVDVITPLAEGLSLDRLRIARAGGDLTWFTPGDGVVTARFTGSAGLDGLGARDAPETGSSALPLSRQGAKPVFQKLEAQASYTQPLAEHLTFDLRARGQTAFNQPLLRSEQIGLAAATGLSTLDAGLIQGDSGYVARAEAQFPFAAPFTLPFAVPSLPAQEGAGLPPDDATPALAVLTPYLFAAFGAVHLEDPTALERATVRAASYGIGLRLGGAPQSSFSAMSVGLEYGRYERSGGLGGGDRLTFTTNVQF